MALEPPVPALPRANSIHRALPPSHALTWLKSGWSDFKRDSMEASLLYGVVVTVVSFCVVAALFVIHIDYVLFPALAGFLLFGPAMALGLYEKSRLLEANKRVGIVTMLKARAQSPGQVAFVALVLALIVALWLRAGVLLFALFFGVREFPGFGKIAQLLFTDLSGWLLLLSGLTFGSLFAAACFAISVFSVPMLLHEKTDAFTAMGSSMALCWNNAAVLIVWGFIVTMFFIVSLLTGLLGLIIIFPVLGHGTWHAYREIRGDPSQPVFSPAIQKSNSDHQGS